MLRYEGSSGGKLASINVSWRIRTILACIFFLKVWRMKRCEICGKVFKLVIAYDKHFSQHEGSTLHKCDICFKDFMHVWQLKSHVHRGHEKLKTHRCVDADDIDSGFFNNGELKRHIRLVHVEAPKHKCEFCDKHYFSNE